MFCRSQQLRFFKKHSDKHVSSPLRRWVHLKVAGGLFAAFFSIPVVSYFWTGASSKEPPESFARGGVQLMMEMAPLNLVSRTIGNVASSTLIPSSVHQEAIRFLVWLYGIDMSDFAPRASYATAQEFFCRKLQLPGASRPVDRAAELVSPCDAELLACGEVADDKTMLQVKGFSYSVDGLFRMTLPPTPATTAGSDATMRRVYFLFHLRPGDYHRVHSPREMKVHKTLYVPGLLYPTTHTATRWLPNLVLSNERVLLFGERQAAE